MASVNTALAGLAAAGKQLAASANNIANQSSAITKGTTAVPRQADVVTLSDAALKGKASGADAQNADAAAPPANNTQEQDAVNMEKAAAAFKANLAVVKVQNAMQQSLLDIQA